jgi:lantibiotic modifying enzyme
LLQESAATAALASIHEIADALEAEIEKIRQEAAVPAPPQHYTSAYQLGEGAAGIAVFFAYLHRTGVRPARQMAFDYLDIAIEALATQPMGPSLYSGFTGVGWAARHVTELMGESSGDLTEELDMALEKYVSQSPWKEDYDLISGLTGFGVYCLEQTGSAAARRALEQIVERLDELAERSGDEVRWFTRPEMLSDEQRKDHPDGYYNAGLAHGIPGIIALLGRSYHARIAREKSLSLLEGAVRWLLRQRLPAGRNSIFPGFVHPSGPTDDCRLAWCYGDGGVPAALMLAARCTDRKDWEAEALDIARAAAQREPERCGIRDVCFCHGAAGLAHIFNRFYQAAGDETFAGAARYWLERGLQFRKPGTGAAGYSVWTANDQLDIVFTGRMGIIEGISGVGLTLLAATTSLEPAWDRMFQVDIPPR